MSFTDAEKQHWHAARKAGLDPEDYSPEELAAELASLAVSGGEAEGVAALSECSHCGQPLPEASTSEFPLCGACQG